MWLSQEERMHKNTQKNKKNAKDLNGYTLTKTALLIR